MIDRLQSSQTHTKTILAFVGMPGAGKSEAVSYLEQKHIPFVRFGAITEEGLLAVGLPVTTNSERNYREKLRKELGMAAYAIRAKPKIQALLEKNTVIAIDGLYSWEEYTYLQDMFSSLVLIHVYAERKKRYVRLTHRAVRPVPLEKCYERDVSEIERLNKGGPIAIADFLIENNSNDFTDLYKKIDSLLTRLHIDAL